MKKIILLLILIFCFLPTKSSQDKIDKKLNFEVIKEGEYFIKVSVEPAFTKAIPPSGIEEKVFISKRNIAEEVREEIKSTGENAIKNLDLIATKVIEEITSFGIMSIEDKYIYQIRALKEEEVAEIEAISKDLTKKIGAVEEKKDTAVRAIEQKKDIELRESTEKIIFDKILKGKETKKEDTGEKESFVEQYFRIIKDIEKRIDEGIKSLEEKTEKEIENIKIYNIPDIKYVEAQAIKEMNTIKQKAIEENRVAEEKYREEFKDIERMVKERDLTRLEKDARIPVFTISQTGKTGKKIENQWMDNFELNFLAEEPFDLEIYPIFRVDYQILRNKEKHFDLNCHFNIDSNKDDIADMLAVTKENDLEKNYFLNIHFGNQGFNRPFKIKNRRYLIEREMGLKAEDDWYYDFINASFKQDFQEQNVVIEAKYNEKDFSDVMLRRRFNGLDLQKYPFLAIEFEVFEGAIPWVYLTLRVDTTGNGRPDKSIELPWVRETFGEFIFDAYEVAKKIFPGEKSYFLVEATIHFSKKGEFEQNAQNRSRIYLKKYSSFNYFAPKFINSNGKKEDKKLVYITPTKVENLEKSNEYDTVEVDLKGPISQLNNKEWNKYSILSGKIFIKDRNKIDGIIKPNFLIKRAYFFQSKELTEYLRLLRGKKDIIRQTIPKKEEIIENERASKEKMIGENIDKIKEKDSFKKDVAEEKEVTEYEYIPSFFSVMAYPTSTYLSILDVLKEKKMFIKEIGYKELFNLSEFKFEKTFEDKIRDPIINWWEIKNQNCDFSAARANNSFDLKIKFKDKSDENSFFKLKKRIYLNLNKYNILKIETKDIPKEGEIICQLIIDVDGKKQGISFGLEENKEYDILKNIPNKKALLSEVVLILRSNAKISTSELNFKLKSLSFYSYTAGDILNYLKNTYVRGIQPKNPIFISSEEVVSEKVHFSDFYKEKKQALFFIFQESEKNKNQIKISHFFEPDIFIEKWKRFEFEYFVDNPESLEMILKFLINLSGGKKVDKVVTYQPELIRRNNNDSKLIELGFNIFEGINNLSRIYPDAKLIGMEIWARKRENASFYSKTSRENNLFLISNLRLSKEEYEDTIYNEILTLPIVEIDGRQYTLEHSTIFDDNSLIQSIVNGNPLILMKIQLSIGKHEIKMIKHPWLNVKKVEIAN